VGEKTFLDYYIPITLTNAQHDVALRGAGKAPSIPPPGRFQRHGSSVKEVFSTEEL
jgi:hypothetical protein